MRRRSHHHWRYATAATAATVAIALTAGCGSDSGDSSGADDGPSAADAAQQRLADNPALADLVAAAEEEGALNLNWGLHGQGALDSLVDAFQAAYGLDLDVTLTPDQNMPGNTAKLIQEHNAGSPSSTDALLGNPELIRNAAQAGALAETDWAAVAPWTEGLASDDNMALSLLDQIPGFTYNTTLLSEEDVPRTAADVLEMDEAIASTPYAAQFNVLGAEEAMGVDGVRDYVRAFEPEGYFGCGELNRVASGEFAALWISCGKNLAEVVAAEGAPLETAVLQDAASVSSWYMGIPANAQHPSAATLFATWLVTPEAQEMLYEHEFADNRRVEGSRTAEEIAAYEADGVTFTEVDYEFTASHPELYNTEFKDELIGLLTTK
ncbi:ABC transporter substrate-binding protein [Streptomyces sp. URMC 129]|uniref:ABC transporter substrate-binding protein n=1 Tax=Streptomyces sp. URMC 129 TaxID=3423407 RepID=UPI003F1C21D9